MTPTRWPHRWTVRVYYEDTDAGGIVYHANYLRFAERARTEMLRAHGFDHPALAAELGGAFVVRRCSLDLRLPARLDDLLEVSSRPSSVGGARLVLDQSILRAADGRALAVISVELAFIDHHGRPRRLPPGVLAALAAPASSG